MTTKQLRLQRRAFKRYVAVHSTIIRNNPELQRFMKVAYQFGNRAVGEYCERIAKSLLGNDYKFAVRSPYFKSNNWLSKKGLERLKTHKL